MEGDVLRDDQWERLREFVPGGRKGKRGPRSDGRLFLDVLLWLARSSREVRPYQTAKRRYYRWIETGVFDCLFEAVAPTSISNGWRSTAPSSGHRPKLQERGVKGA